MSYSVRNCGECAGCRNLAAVRELIDQHTATVVARLADKMPKAYRLAEREEYALQQQAKREIWAFHDHVMRSMRAADMMCWSFAIVPRDE